ncbi:uncharacterized protein RSE6_11440 [Rhynchosporium secalis]|uniref:Uncharacterized protein n=1 Tax=Rhynchosporium secalis TaxID=38038 RepID=A0A1E1MNX8_RHYSE|nr:uncharacterized protein RSE6_11440 [Rhynchosporium secalis]
MYETKSTRRQMNVDKRESIIEENEDNVSTHICSYLLEETQISTRTCQPPAHAPLSNRSSSANPKAALALFDHTQRLQPDT